MVQSANVAFARVFAACLSLFDPKDALAIDNAKVDCCQKDSVQELEVELTGATYVRHR